MARSIDRSICLYSDLQIFVENMFAEPSEAYVVYALYIESSWRPLTLANETKTGGGK